MLKDEVALYSKLTGKDGLNVPVGIIGAYLDGYERGKADAQPERIKGHWIKISPANIYECSECGKNVMTDDICAYDFCHGCGADMREEKEK